MESFRKKSILAFICLLGAIFLLYHHKITHGFWWSWQDVNNHESIILALTTFAIGVII